jgi:membrane fusion protein, heavy metal efflux system
MSMAPASMAQSGASTPVEPAQEVQISIPSSEVERLRLKFAKVTEASVTTEIRVPGSVQPNAYKQVHVTPLAGGVVTQVAVEIGQSVKRGQTLVQIFSRELAEAQTKYIADGAELEAEHKKLVRTQELVRLGSASRQELEEIEANHQVHSAHVEESRQNLLLLGLSDQQISEVAAAKRADTTIAVPSPFDGVVTARAVNLGQVVNASQDLLTVTDLSSVWVEANLLEDNFAAVRIGSPATITTPAYPGRSHHAAVSYIDPQVDPQTRTAKVRLVLENTGFALRFGMYMDVRFANATGRATVAPKQAVQAIGSSSVVFVPVEGEAGKFIQRTVITGEDSPSGLRILEGLKPGESVVTEGSFLLRAEAIRQRP